WPASVGPSVGPSVAVVDVGWQGGGEGGRLEFLVLVHLGALLQLVVVDDVLVGRARLGEGVQLVHVAHVAPHGRQAVWDLKVRKRESTGDADVLQAWHKLAVEAAHGVACEEAFSALVQVGVNVAQLVQQVLLALLIPPGQHQLELLQGGTQKILYDCGRVLVLHKEVVSPRDVLHDVALYLLILQDGAAPVNQDRRRRRVKVGAEVWRGLEHVHHGCPWAHLERDGLELSQEVQVHEVLLAEEAGPFPAPVDGRRLRERSPPHLDFGYVLDLVNLVMVVVVVGHVGGWSSRTKGCVSGKLVVLALAYQHRPK
ncbi:unnamed protein product, partial [Ixodes hexagonus]